MYLFYSAAYFEKQTKRPLTLYAKFSGSKFPVLFYITQPSKCDSILSYDLSYLLRGCVPYHGQFQKSYQRRIEYGGTGKTTTKQNTINNS